MRSVLFAALSCLALLGCYGTPPAPDAAAGAGTASSTEARVARWEREWDEAKVSVATAREEAVAAGTPPSPALDREVTDLLTTPIDGGLEGEARIERLQDAVSDALRLAELVSLG